MEKRLLGLILALCLVVLLPALAQAVDYTLGDWQIMNNRYVWDADNYTLSLWGPNDNTLRFFAAVDQTINVTLKQSENTINALFANAGSLPLRLVVGGNGGSKLTLSTISGSGSALTVDGALDINHCALSDHAALTVSGSLTITAGGTFALDKTTALNMNGGLSFENSAPSDWAWLSDYLPDGYSLGADGSKVVVLDGSGQPATGIQLKQRVPAIQSGAGCIAQGDKLYFGKYGTYDVPWLVMSINSGSPFVLSEYLLGTAQ